MSQYPTHPTSWSSRALSTVALALACVGPAGAQISIDHTLNVQIGVGNPGSAGEQIVASFDASASSKLVVAISSEHAFGTGSSLTIDSIEYNGQAMVEAVEESTLPGTTALYYLDSPGAAGEIRLFTGNKNGGLATVYALSGTMPGVAAIGQSTTADVAITTTSADALVIAAILDGGQASNGNGAGTPAANLPLIEVHSGTWGNSWGGHACGHQVVVAPGAVTPTFTTAGAVRLRTVAAAFGSTDSGTNYCTSVTNSTGSAATISTGGSTSVGANDLVLNAAPVPNQPGLFFYGPDQVQIPFGNGFRCVGGTVGRLDVHNASSNALSHDLDVTQPPNAATTITAGTSWNFQCWYRDPLAGGASFNLSDGIAVPFTP